MSRTEKQLPGLEWRKSGEVAMRNSRDPGGPVLLFTRAEIDAFVDGIKKKEFDDLT